MRRSLAWPLSLVLALATGATLAQTVSVATTPLAAPVRVERTAETVRAFYDAANAVIRTGDVSALDRVIVPGFVDHRGLPGVTPDLQGLGRYLAALHLTDPDASLVVEVLAVAGDRAMAWVTLRGTERSAFLGIALSESPVVWGRTDVFRVAGAQVAERWGDVEGLVGLEPFGRVPIGEDLPTEGVVVLDRVTLAPGNRTETSVPGSRLLSVEAGAVTVSVAAGALTTDSVAAGGRQRPVALGTAVTLSSGDLIALPASVPAVLRNNGSTSAIALVATIFPLDDPALSAPRDDPAYSRPAVPSSPNMVTRPLTRSVATELPAKAAAAGVGRVVLLPGGRLPAFAAPGPVLLWVETGSVELDMADGTIWFRRGASGAGQGATTASLAAGDGALIPLGSVVALRAVGAVSVAVLVVAITSTD